MKINVTNGEIVDKVTILNVKISKISSKQDLLPIVIVELKTLLTAYSVIEKNIGKQLIDSLREINRQLWEAEDKIREKVAKSEFDSSFIEVARTIILLNDQRAAIKQRINKESQSTLKTTDKIYTFT